MSSIACKPYFTQLYPPFFFFLLKNKNGFLIKHLVLSVFCSFFSICFKSFLFSFKSFEFLFSSNRKPIRTWTLWGFINRFRWKKVCFFFFLVTGWIIAFFLQLVIITLHICCGTFSFKHLNASRTRLWQDFEANWHHYLPSKLHNRPP